MNKPTLILFDYGQTIINELFFDGTKGTEAVMRYCTSNPQNLSAQEIQAHADDIINSIRGNLSKSDLRAQIEVHNHFFQNYLYQSLDIHINLSPDEIEKVFWDHAAPCIPTVNIEDLLEFLHSHNIRTGVISNLSFSQQSLINRINKTLPCHHFEFILGSSEYVFRKPNRRIFELALTKAKLNAKDVWYCGNDVICDVEGASSAGIFPVWYTGALNQEQPKPAAEHLQIDNWHQLISVLNNLL